MKKNKLFSVFTIALALCSAHTFAGNWQFNSTTSKWEKNITPSALNFATMTTTSLRTMVMPLAGGQTQIRLSQTVQVRILPTVFSQLQADKFWPATLPTQPMYAKHLQLLTHHSLLRTRCVLHKIQPLLPTTKPENFWVM